MAVQGSRAELVGFPGSELHRDAPVELPSRTIEEVLFRDETAEAGEPVRPRESPESVEGHGGAPGKTLTAVKKQKVRIANLYLINTYCAFHTQQVNS